MKERSTRRRFSSLLSSWWAVVFVVLLAAALRVYRLSGQSLWADEGNSAALALRDLSTIAQNAAADIHPPLYYWALHLWVRLFGSSEAALRSLSVLAGVVAVWAVWQWARRLGGSAFALLAAFLAAISPFAVAYSQEARMYMLLGAVTSLGYLALTDYIGEERAGGRFPWKAGVGYALCCAGGLYTHYTFALVWATYNLGYLLSLREKPQRSQWKGRLVRWSLLQAAVLVLYAPWLSTALERVLAWPSVRAPLPLPLALQQAWTWLVAGPCPGVASAAGLLVAFGLAVAGGWAFWRDSRTPKGPGVARAMLPLMGVIFPILGVVVLGLSKPAYFKFLLVADGPLSLLLARGLWLWRDSGGSGQAFGRRLPALRWPTLWKGIWLVLGLGILLASRVQGLHDYYFAGACARDDYRGMAAYIAAVARPGDGVVLNAPGQADVFGYYDQGTAPVYLLPRQRPPDPAQTEAKLTEIAGQHRRLFVLFWATDESDPDRLVETWLDQNAYKAMDSWQGNVRFVIYAIPQSTTEAEIKPLDVRFGGDIRLRGYALPTNQIAPGDVLQVTLLWQAESTPSRRYRVTVQLLDEQDQVLAQRDAEPVGDARPTTSWAPGEWIRDNYGLFIPFGTPPGRSRLLVALYQPEDGSRLPVEGPGGRGDHLILPEEVLIERPEAPPPLSALPVAGTAPIELGELRWLGCRIYPREWAHQPDRPFFPGDEVHLDCYWQAVSAPAHRWELEAMLADGSGRVLAQLEQDLASDVYPTTAWQAGEVVRGQHDLLLGGTPAGDYQLRLRAVSDAGPPPKEILRRPLPVQSPPP